MVENKILKDLSKIGKEYTHGGIDKQDLKPNPVEQFIVWMDEAIDKGIEEPNAMIFSTVSVDGKPSSRVVLLKYITEKGFVFFTNYTSRKAKQLDANLNASAVFPWSALERQIRIEGQVEKVNAEFSNTYFNSRPIESQMGAVISPQSQVIASRQFLIDKKEELEQSFKDKKLIRPYFWGGYVLIPNLIEFWQGRPNRLSDRLQYRIDEGKWIVERLAP
jgi:pyridoxamine 5'-phosphate oxidase